VTPRGLAQRRRILFTMLAVLTYRYPSGREPALIPALRAWFGGWPGIGRIVVGMARQGFDLDLTRYDGEGWRPTFFAEGRAHSLTAAVGSGWEREPWTAVQRGKRLWVSRGIRLFAQARRDGAC
jgi:hypothetical protein